MDKLKVGVIGVGHLGKLHTKMFSLLENCQLVGVFDSDLEKSKSVAEEFKTISFSELSELLSQTNAVSIAATTSAHFELAMKAIEFNNHIFIEKPITATIDEAEKLVEFAEKKNLNIQVGHIERFNPGLLAIESYIKEPKFIQSDRLAPFNPRGTDVAVVLDLMIHDIDIILSLVKSKVVDVVANGVEVVSDNIDIANARIEFENGAVANVTASRISQKRMRKMRIFQKDSYLSLDFNTGASEIYNLIPLNSETPENAMVIGEIGIGDKKKRLIFEQPDKVDVNALQYELQLFVNSIIENKKPVVSGYDGLRALRIADLIIQKINQSKRKLL
ncbi:MAG: Gfo/Idh/MocA family oxidoreductase [Ignavibacterium sp.]|nr:Gfo/Idh/MocA family oxidoreductase [Ignavibacterium sp.]MCX7611798.1 Gfo/Idh/MocA family oxidoreductase [Ignavibacterium sp.]MDW8374391.1 Gfo/Idh/MocA family oxidoreductase [Ignavibacteriales bacterium]